MIIVLSNTSCVSLHIFYITILGGREHRLGCVGVYCVEERCGEVPVSQKQRRRKLCPNFGFAEIERHKDDATINSGRLGKGKLWSNNWVVDISIMFSSLFLARVCTNSSVHNTYFLSNFYLSWIRWNGANMTGIQKICILVTKFTGTKDLWIHKSCKRLLRTFEMLGGLIGNSTYYTISLKGNLLNILLGGVTHTIHNASTCIVHAFKQSFIW